MGACRATAGTKQSDVDKARAKKKKVLNSKQEAKRAAELEKWGPVTDRELAKATGAARGWLTLSKNMQQLEKPEKVAEACDCGRRRGPMLEGLT